MLNFILKKIAAKSIQCLPNIDKQALTALAEGADNTILNRDLIDFNFYHARIKDGEDIDLETLKWYMDFRFANDQIKNLEVGTPLEKNLRYAIYFISTLGLLSTGIEEDPITNIFEAIPRLVNQAKASISNAFEATVQTSKELLIFLNIMGAQAEVCAPPTPPPGQPLPQSPMRTPGDSFPQPGWPPVRGASPKLGR